MLSTKSSLAIAAIILALVSAVFATGLLFIDWLEWQVSILDRGAGYTIDVRAEKFKTSRYVDDTDVLGHVAIVYSPTGQCVWGKTKIVSSLDDQQKEKIAILMIESSIVGSYLLLVLAVLNLIYRKWKRFYPVSLFLFVLTVMIPTASSYLGYKSSGDQISVPPLFDPNCQMDLLLNIRFITINPLATILTTANIIVTLVTIILLLLGWRSGKTAIALCSTSF